MDVTAYNAFPAVQITRRVPVPGTTTGAATIEYNTANYDIFMTTCSSTTLDGDDPVCTKKDANSLFVPCDTITDVKFTEDGGWNSGDPGTYYDLLVNNPEAEFWCPPNGDMSFVGNEGTNLWIATNDVGSGSNVYTDNKISVLMVS
jgi:hypothetical protein